MLVKQACNDTAITQSCQTGANMTTQLQQAQSLLHVHMCTQSYGPYQLHERVSPQHPHCACPAPTSNSHPFSQPHC